MKIDLEKEALIAAEKLRPLIPHLSIDALVNLVGTGNIPCVLSIASAKKLPPSICASIAETSDQSVVVELLKNRFIEIPEFSYLRIIERFGDDFTILSALEGRNDLSIKVWWEIMLSRLNLIFAVSDIAIQSREINRTDDAIIALLWASPVAVREAYIDALNHYSAITPSLIIKSLYSDDLDVTISLLSKLSFVASHKINRLFYDRDVQKIMELAQKIKIPQIIMSDFLNAVEENFQYKNEPMSWAA